MEGDQIEFVISSEILFAVENVNQVEFVISPEIVFDVGNSNQLDLVIPNDVIYYSDQSKIIPKNNIGTNDLYPGEMWKSLELLDLPNYAISSYGRLYSIHRYRLKKLSNAGGYMRTVIKISKEEIKHLSLHYLVAKMFVYNPDPINKNTIDHADRNRSNNHYLNLRWATPVEQGANKSSYIVNNCRSIYQMNKNTDEIIKKWNSMKEAKAAYPLTGITSKQFQKGHIKGGFKWKYADCLDMNFSDEIWKPIEIDSNQQYLVSSYGNVKNQHTARILKPMFDKEYLVVVISTSNNIHKNYLIHRLVSSAFHGSIPEDYVVNHLDGNKTNNKLENLEAITYQQNTQHAYDTGLISRIKSVCSVYQIDLNNNVIAQFKSVKQINDLLGYNQSGISDACTNKAIRYGYKWRYVNISNLTNIVISYVSPNFLSIFPKEDSFINVDDFYRIV